MGETSTRLAGIDRFLGFDPDAGSFRFGEGLYGSFGGIFGGALGAACVRAARQQAPGRIPFSLDCRFLRSVPAGQVTPDSHVTREGRSMTTVEVTLHDAAGSPATQATVLLVDSGVLAVRDADGAPGAVRPPLPHDQLDPMVRVPVAIPIVESMSPRTAHMDDGAIVTSIRLPWVEEGTGPEAACMAADFCVGPPVFQGMGEPWTPHPNPDLSLRFAAGPETGEVAGVGRLERIAGGVAMVRVEVWVGGTLTGIGVSTSLLMPQ